MKEKFMRFMQGRYGVLDTLGKVLLVLGLVLAFFAPVFSGDHVIGMVFYLLGWGCLIYAYFRMFSRNVRKRYDENVRFLNKTAKIRGFFKNTMSRSFLSYYLYMSRFPLSGSAHPVRTYSSRSLPRNSQLHPSM